MTDNDVGYVDETYEEFGVSYQRLESNDDENNEEETVEYLDLDTEIEVVPDSIEYLSESTEPSKGIPIIESSIRNTRNNDANPRKQETAYKPVRPKHTSAIPELRTTHSRSYARKSSNFKISKRSAKKRNEASGSNDAILNNPQDETPSNGHSETNPNTRISEAVENLRNNDNIQNNNFQVKLGEDGVDLFFQSMAQTVLNLPLQIQAKIKMEICRVITVAEIKYRTSDNDRDFNEPKTR